MAIKRDATIDGVKFLLICMVVVGHSLEPSRYSCNISGWLYSPIYLFHMPLFVLLSGYFSKNLKWESFKDSALKLTETYAITSLWVIVLANRSLKEFINPTQANWHLLSLIFWRFFIMVCKKIKIGGGD